MRKRAAFARERAERAARARSLLSSLTFSVVRPGNNAARPRYEQAQAVAKVKAKAEEKARAKLEKLEQSKVGKGAKAAKKAEKALDL